MTTFADNYEPGEAPGSETMRRFWRQVDTDRAHDPWSSASVAEVREAAQQIGVAGRAPFLRAQVRRAELEVGLAAGELLTIIRGSRK